MFEQRRIKPSPNAGAQASRADAPPRPEFDHAAKMHALRQPPEAHRTTHASSFEAAPARSNDDQRPQTQVPRGASWDFGALPIFPPGGRSLAAPAGVLQTKLEIGTVDDPLEREADAVADSVMRMPDPAPTLSLSPPRISRKCADCEEEENKKVQMKAAGAASPLGAAPPIVHEVLREPGQPLEPGTRAFFEPRFGHDLGDVRLHKDSKSAKSAEALNARAYTVGRQIVLGDPQSALNSPSTMRLMAHELAHVAQQNGYSSSATIRRSDNDGSGPGRATTASANRETAVGDGDVAAVLRTAERARQNPNDSTNMMLSAAQIGYRLIKLYLPDYAGKISGVGYEEKLPGVRVVLDHQNLSVTLGKQFVLDTNQETLSRRALDIGGAILAKMPRDSNTHGGLLEEMYQQQQAAPGPKVSFDEALKEGADVLHAAGFGLVCGARSGPDAEDGYDVRDWEEQTSRPEVLVAKAEPWLAFSRLVKNIGKQVPGSTGPTKWSFDCFGFVILNRVYAYWRTLSRAEFNAHFTPLELGVQSRVNKEWNRPVESLKPGDKPFVGGEVEARPGGQFVEKRTPVGKSWDQLLEAAPIGAQITWGNQDAKTKCGKDASLEFCPFTYENTTKVGPNQYSAHPFGIVTREFIEDAMAESVLSAEHKPVTPATKRAYIKKFVYVSGMRTPKEGPVDV